MNAGPDYHGSMAQFEVGRPAVCRACLVPTSVTLNDF